jgi:uncharacterized protein with NRDE domain
VHLLGHLGLERGEAQAALAAVALVLLGEKKGTRAVWIAFTEELKNAAGRYHNSEDPVLRADRDESWDALQVHRKTMAQHMARNHTRDSEDDITRIFDKMEAATMTNEDRNTFLQFMANWEESLRCDVPTDPKEA